jgi:hypothetical protein
MRRSSYRQVNKLHAKTRDGGAAILLTSLNGTNLVEA